MVIHADDIYKIRKAHTVVDELVQEIDQDIQRSAIYYHNRVYKDFEWLIERLGNVPDDNQEGILKTIKRMYEENGFFVSYDWYHHTKTGYLLVVWEDE